MFYYSYTLSFDHKNIQRIINEIESIGDKDILEIARDFPLILSAKPETIKQNLKYFKMFGISNEQILYSIRILITDPDINKHRLYEIQALDELKEFRNQSSFLLFLGTYIKAAERFSHLKRTDRKCFSMFDLITSYQIFNKFVIEIYII